MTVMSSAIAHDIQTIEALQSRPRKRDRLSRHQRQTARG